MDNQLMKPNETAEYARVTVAHLAQMRFRGSGPKYLKPTPRTVLYRRSDVDAWLNASERTGSGRVA